MLPTEEPVRNRFAAIPVMAIFFALATLILIGVGAALLFPDSWPEIIWRLYPARRVVLMPHRIWLGPGFLALAVVMASASVGCFLRRSWGWWLSVALFATNGLGDAVQLALGRVLEGAIGMTVAIAILIYLFRSDVRRAFRPGD